jgi:uncharacterized membrane protein
MKQTKKKGSRKIGRSKRAKDLATSLYSRGKITYEQYKKMKGA